MKTTALLALAAALLAVSACGGGTTSGPGGSGGEAGGGAGGSAGAAGVGGDAGGGAGGDSGGSAGQAGGGGSGGSPCEPNVNVCDGACGIQFDGCSAVVDCGICTSDCPLIQNQDWAAQWESACEGWAPMDQICGAIDAPVYAGLCGAYPKLVDGCAFFGTAIIDDPNVSAPLWCCCSPTN